MLFSKLHSFCSVLPTILSDSSVNASSLFEHISNFDDEKLLSDRSLRLSTGLALFFNNVAAFFAPLMWSNGSMGSVLTLKRVIGEAETFESYDEYAGGDG